MSRPRVLVVEDDRAIREGLADALAFHGYAALKPDAAFARIDPLHTTTELVALTNELRDERR